MSLVAARVGMRHRVDIHRQATVDDGGGASDSTWDTSHLTAVPCRAWTDVRRDTEAEHGDKITVTSDRRLVVPLDTDVTEADQIGDVTERGQVVLAGPMRIEAIARHRTHLELLVDQVS